MISVVIPARNAARSVPATLAALDQPEVGEVIVVDNGSTDDTAAVARAAGATVLVLAQARRAAARNRGAEAAREERLAFMDADCVAESGWAAAMTQCLGEAPLAGGAVRLSAREAPSAIERFDVRWRFQQERTIREGGWGATANLGVTREAFDAVGGFDPAYRSSDDVDFCLRARRLGLPIGWCPNAVVSHAASTSLTEILVRGYRQGRGNSQLHRRLEGAAGRRYWRHPGGVVRRDAALRALNVDPDALEPAERRRMARIARLDYLARVVGSAAGELRRA